MPYPPWRPLRAFDDGKKVYIEFPRGIAQGEMPPLFIVGPEGKTSQLVNYRVRASHMIVDRLFAAAELRLGDGASRSHCAHRPTTLLVSGNGGEPKPDRDRDLAADLRLRPERPPVTRFSRRVLMGIAAVAAISVSSALIWGLYQGQKKSTGGTELYNTENKPAPDGLTTLPRDYSGLPRSSPPPIAPGVPPLGPPLPGDLGRPIRNAQAPVTKESVADAEQQRITQETEAARTSRLFATTNARERPTAPNSALPTTTAPS